MSLYAPNPSPFSGSPAGLAAMDERARDIFRRIVETYLETGEPVGSRAIARRLSENLSPATIRNVMSDLQDLGLLTPRSLLPHGIYTHGDDDLQRVVDGGASLVHCPTSNTFIGSGLFDMGLAQSLRVGLATDTGGGSSFSMLHTMAAAYEVAQLRGQALHPSHLLWLATVGSARALRAEDKIGNLAPGMEADLVISATGVRPAIGFLKDSGITCLLGVLTDDHLQTNVPGIYAAGDCAEAFDKVSGKTIVSAIQPNAAEQARVAALNMAHRGPTPLAELKGVTQINVLDTLGMISTSFGNWEGVAGGEHVELTDKAGGRHLSLQFKDDVMVGCNSVGWTEHVGVMRGLVEGQVRLGEWKQRLMEDPTKLMDAYLAAAQAQGQWAGAADERRR